MYIGETKVMNNGLKATCVAIRGRNDCDFQFENGVLREHVRYDSFRTCKLGLKSNKQLHDEANIRGTRVQMKSGEFATCIDYRTNTDIDIRFDDGTELYHCMKTHFINGCYTNPNSESRFSLKGTIVDMNCGMKAVCIEDRGCNDIDIMFEDETVVTTTRGNFRKGSVTNPTLGRGQAMRIKHDSFVGLEKYMNCGYKCKITKCDFVWDITVEFDDGSIVEHRYKSEFDRGSILHPKLGMLWKDGDSVAQRLIFYWFKKIYPDTVYNLRPDWLKNPSTGNNFELDIYIPSLRIAVEFDGSVPSHFSYNETNTTKASLIQRSNKIDKIYVIREMDRRIVTFSGDKYSKFYNISLSYKGINGRLPDVIDAINIIFSDLGLSTKANFSYDVISKLYSKEDFKCLLEVKQISGES